MHIAQLLNAVKIYFEIFGQLLGTVKAETATRVNVNDVVHSIPTQKWLFLVPPFFVQSLLTSFFGLVCGRAGGLNHAKKCELLKKIFFYKTINSRLWKTLEYDFYFSLLKWSLFLYFVFSHWVYLNNCMSRRFVPWTRNRNKPSLLVYHLNQFASTRRLRNWRKRLLH